MKRNILGTMNARNRQRAYVMALMLVFAMVFTSSGVQMTSANGGSAPVTLTQPLFALQNPELDSTFHFDGRVTTDFGPHSEEALALAVQPDGKVIVAGYAYNMATSPYTYSDFALARYNSDGSLDNSFGDQGKVTTDFNRSMDVVNDVAIQPDGKIVAAGYASLPSGTHAFGVARYKTDGSIDDTFGELIPDDPSGELRSGKLTTEFGPFRSEAEAVAIQMDGKIVLAGHHLANPGWHEDHVALARYNSDGTLDESFNWDGRVLKSLGGGSCSNSSSRAYDLAIQPDGRLVIVGHAGINGGTPDTCSVVALTVARFSPWGELDGTFDDNGVAYTSFTTGSFPRNSGEAVALQSDGKILAAGSVQINPNGALNAFAVARYNWDGSLDGTFGKEGKMITTVGTNNTATAHSMTVESGGKILLAGSKGTFGSSQQDFFLARYNPDGFLDDSFGAGGTYSIDFGNTDGRGVSDDNANAIALQPDGRIVMAGSSGSYANPSSLVAGRLSTHVTDLAIDMNVITNDVVTGTNFTYTITVTNRGPNLAEAVEITDVLPPELTFVSSDPATEGQDNHRILRLSSLESGASVTLTIEATVSCLAVPGKVIANTAPVTSLIQDSDMSNNSARAEGIAWVELPIKCSPDIVSTKQVVNYPPPKISESWPDVISVDCSPRSGSSFPIGTTSVKCVATDKQGNTASCRFNVTVAMPSTK